MMPTLLLPLLACTGSTPADTAGGDTAGDTDTVPTSMMTATVVDLVSGERLGATVQYGEVVGDTTGDGTVIMDVPSHTQGWVTVDADGYLPLQGYWVQENRSQLMEWYMVTLTGATMLFQSFGVTFQRADALVNAVAVTPSSDFTTMVPLAGVGFDLAETYDIALLPDLAGGYAEGTTTLDGGVVVFAGLDVGNVNLTVTAPDGMECVNWISLDGRQQMTEYAVVSGVNVLIWYCE